MRNLLECARQGISNFGLYVTMPDPQIIEMAKTAGYDFARIDGEHVSFDSRTLTEMFRIARLLDFPLQIRVGSMENLDVILALEPAAVMVPDIRAREDARLLAERTKFAPLGSRGMYAFSDGIRFGGWGRDEYVKAANERLHTIVQIESREGLEHLEEILLEPGVDMVSSGKADLSQALGLPGKITDPQVIGAEERIIKMALQYNKVPTLFAESPKRIRELEKLGVHCFIVGFDCALCMGALRDKMEEIRNRPK